MPTVECPDVAINHQAERWGLATPRLMTNNSVRGPSAVTSPGQAHRGMRARSLRRLVCVLFVWKLSTSSLAGPSGVSVGVGGVECF